MFEIFLKRDSFSWVDGTDALPVDGTKAEAVATEAAMRRAETFMVARGNNNRGERGGGDSVC